MRRARVARPTSHRTPGVATRCVRDVRSLAMALALLATSVPLRPAQSQDGPARSARTLSPDWRMRDLYGRDVPLRTFRGRPIVLNLWATWCAPCVAELGSLERLRDSLRARGRDDVVFLLVAPETRRSVQRFRERRPIGLPLFVELDPLPPVLGLRAVPSTWLIDRDGRIAAEHRGARVWDAPDAIAFVQRSLP